MSAKKGRKQLLNEGAGGTGWADDVIRGAVAAYPQLRLHTAHRTVTVHHKVEVPTVAVISGGGAGHEPFASGYVGAGLLAGAVSGALFASPPSHDVLYAIRHLHKYHKGGVLVMIGNYTGDRLNFGNAIEKAKAVGLKVEGVIVGEDLASRGHIAGGRSLCGSVLFYKLCGALAARGGSISELIQLARDANSCAATLGVCLHACSLPGEGPLFSVSPDKMEVGVGVHGEAGTHSEWLLSARETVHMLLTKLTEALGVNKGSRVVVLINNLGGCTQLEQGALAAETKQYLEDKGVTVERLYAGLFKTSLDMHGAQICLLHLPEGDRCQLWLELLDAPTDAPGWRGSVLSQRPTTPVPGDDPDLEETEEKQKDSGPTMSSDAGKAMRAALVASADKLKKEEPLLNKLDARCGDGDCGTTLAAFAKGVENWVNEASDTSLQHPASVLSALGELAERQMGGTSGALYALALRAAASELERQRSVSVEGWAKAWEAATSAVIKYGGAAPGDRSMVDALCAGAAALLGASAHGPWRGALRGAGQAADRAAADTQHMTPRVGRAAYVGDSGSEARQEDAGARGVSLWVTAIVDALEDCTLQS